MPPCFFQTAQTAQTAPVLYRIHYLPYLFIQKGINQYAFRMNQYSHRAAFSVLALGLAALALATLTMLGLAALTVWPVALASSRARLAKRALQALQAQACDWAGPARAVSAQVASALQSSIQGQFAFFRKPARRVSARAASAGLLTPLHLV